jgi:uncharacterized protein YceH (UPF0502 family)
MELNIELNPHEARLFGVLVEKALSTPEQYPLTLNAATNGANQKNNRDPVMSLDEVEVAIALESLVKKYLARKVFPGNSRVEKYCHNGKDALNLDAAALAVIAELLMRGPQMPGELRTRCSRMIDIPTLDDLQRILDPLIARNLVVRLPPAPGSRTERYAQRLSPDSHSLEAPPAPAAASGPSRGEGIQQRMVDLEARVAALEERVEQLAAQVGSGAKPPQSS